MRRATERGPWRTRSPARYKQAPPDPLQLARGLAALGNLGDSANHLWWHGRYGGRVGVVPTVRPALYSGISGPTEKRVFEK